MVVRHPAHGDVVVTVVVDRDDIAIARVVDAFGDTVGTHHGARQHAVAHAGRTLLDIPEAIVGIEGILGIGLERVLTARRRHLTVDRGERADDSDGARRIPFLLHHVRDLPGGRHLEGRRLAGGQNGHPGADRLQERVIGDHRDRLVGVVGERDRAVLGGIPVVHAVVVAGHCRGQGLVGRPEVIIGVQRAPDRVGQPRNTIAEVRVVWEHVPG